MNGLDLAMLPTLLLVAVASGVMGGVLAGLLGVGGGIVIVPALYFAFSHTDMDPALTIQLSVGTSLATIIFTSMSSSWGHFKQGAIDLTLLKRWSLPILIGVVVGAMLGGVVSGWILIVIFATVAALVSLSMMFTSAMDARRGREHSNTV